VVVVDPEAFTSTGPPHGGVPIAIEPAEHLYRYSDASEVRALFQGAWNEWFATWRRILESRRRRGGSTRRSSSWPRLHWPLARRSRLRAGTTPSS
jgi:hypothetical protein